MNKEYKVEKIAVLTEEQFNTLNKGHVLNKEIRKITNIPTDKEVYVGDSMVHLRTETSKGEVYKCIYEKAEVICIVIEPVNEQMSFCFTIN